jgi:hypothetical protein
MGSTEREKIFDKTSVIRRLAFVRTCTYAVRYDLLRLYRKHHTVQGVPGREGDISDGGGSIEVGSVRITDWYNGTTQPVTKAVHTEPHIHN